MISKSQLKRMKVQNKGEAMDKECQLAYLMGRIQAGEGNGKDCLEWHLRYTLICQMADQGMTLRAFRREVLKMYAAERAK